ncbi:hypothetical protein A2X44_03250 [candidate division CPR3 bacterium GWF2_35_18]|nr:MAG: hypothetical protein A2X44_03250 [candidate division CPR3 bacterium GWF2_35_18]OGB63975.1 MAG: hypothetical protein A2250_02955 [candidate division CPR3 bacterium RIFOXYA2_FULL_35_13]OGB78427.1 MAG: hypothetical protein A2296_03635 [candidate division CPR3 bacterium RIFOXYB2_FULL_35_8]OGB79858.1 MAG: hypothetical protein A2011_00950 [candidate division CPR3 bacterium GWE2_35_7]
MAVIRKASLDSHAAARDVGEDNPARSSARSAGQAVATAHVKTLLLVLQFMLNRQFVEPQIPMML